MSTAEKCEAIMREIVREANSKLGCTISFGADWGGNSLTITFPDGSHTHVGDVEFTWERFIDTFHALMCGGLGLSRATE